MADRTCSVEGCDRKHSGRGWCRLHYERMKLTGRLDVAPRPNRRPCKVNGCDGISGAKGTARGWCSKHYNAWYRWGDPLGKAPRPPAKGSGPCRVDGCESLIFCRGLCSGHYSNLLRHGEVEPRKRGEVRDGKRICARCKVDTLTDDMYRSYCRPCASQIQRAYQAEVPESVWRHAATRRARLNAARSEEFERVEIFDRDAWTCQICGTGVDRLKPWRKPNSPSLDHIIPLARGGAHSRANSQTACLRCNMRKGARTT